MFAQVDDVEATACRGPVPYLLIETGNERRGIFEGLSVVPFSHRPALAVSCKRSLLLFEHGQVPGSSLRLPSPLLERFLECSCLLTHDVHLFRSRFGFWGIGGLSRCLDRLSLLVQLELQRVEPAEQLTDLGLELQDLGLYLSQALAPLFDALDHFVVSALLCGQLRASLRLLAPQLVDGRGCLAGQPRRLKPAGIPALFLTHKPRLLCHKILGLLADGNQFLLEPVRILPRFAES